jgi:hypothetical protein
MEENVIYSCDKYYITINSSEKEEWHFGQAGPTGEPGVGGEPTAWGAP